MHANRPGFTLFEVALCLGLMLIAVGSVLALLPKGVATQQLARARILAAIKAQDFVNAAQTFANDNPSSDVEARFPWEVPPGGRVHDADLEIQANRPRNGVLPLPLSLARRLDSDGDEIAHILDAGGQLYYANPAGSGSSEERATSVTAPPELQRLVFAIVGPAQHNQISIWPRKAWPYYNGYPSGPSHGIKDVRLYAMRDAAGTVQPWVVDRKFDGYRGTLWEGFGDPADVTAYADGNEDPDIAMVFNTRVGDRLLGVEQIDPAGFSAIWGPAATTSTAPGAGYETVVYHLQSASPGDSGNTTASAAVAASAASLCGAGSASAAIAYVAAANWYATRKGFAFNDLTALPLAPALDWAGTDPTTRWTKVQALRFLAHATACLTKPLTKVQLDAGVLIPPVTIRGVAAPGLTVYHQDLVDLQERCLSYAATYVAADPYDWGAPRPLNRPIMMDHPLMEWDLFGPTISATIVGSTITATGYRALPARPITSAGRSVADPRHRVDNQGADADPALAGLPQVVAQADQIAQRSTLCTTFGANERARQLVFWMVNWQSYEDFETAPSAPIDASKYPFSAPVELWSGSGAPDVLAFWARRGHNENDAWVNHHLYAFFHPERASIFLKSVAALDTGTSVDDPTWLWEAKAAYDDRLTEFKPSDGPEPNAGTSAFLGRWGADRNGNRRVDRGPVAVSVRMRATAVSRFMVYDPRLLFVLR